jgi:hypothetical protein
MFPPHLEAMIRTLNMLRTDGTTSMAKENEPPLEEGGS